MRGWWFAIAASAAALLLAGSDAVHASDSCSAGCPVPPRNARSISIEPQLMPAFPATLATTQLLRGRRRTILNVEAMIVSGNSAPSNMGMTVGVNGIRMEPLLGNLPLGVSCPFPQGPSCTLIGTFWLDLDQNPSLIDVPLVIELAGGDFPHAPGTTFSGTLSARLTKK